jgi:hypothetical protein
MRISDEGLPEYKQPDAAFNFEEQLQWEITDLPNAYRVICGLPVSPTAEENPSDISKLPFVGDVSFRYILENPEEARLNTYLTANMYACLAFRFGYFIRQMEENLLQMKGVVSPRIQDPLHSLTQRKTMLDRVMRAERKQVERMGLPEAKSKSYLWMLRSMDTETMDQIWPQEHRQTWCFRQHVAAEEECMEVELDRIMHQAIDEDPLVNSGLLRMLDDLAEELPGHIRTPTLDVTFPESRTPSAGSPWSDARWERLREGLGGTNGIAPPTTSPLYGSTAEFATQPEAAAPMALSPDRDMNARPQEASRDDLTYQGGQIHWWRPDGPEDERRREDDIRSSEFPTTTLSPLMGNMYFKY